MLTMVDCSGCFPAGHILKSSDDSALYQDADDISLNDAIAEGDEEASLSESRLSEEGDEDDDLKSGGMSSMSVFMSSLVGLHSEDWSFCLQVDNAKPRDLPPPPPPPSSTSTITSASGGSSSKNAKNRKISRWESTPTSAGKSPTSVSSELTAVRPRAMRPWRPNGTPSSSSSATSVSSHSNASNITSNSKKADIPILLPKRHDSKRSLINAKRPQRLDSNRSLKTEVSLRDLGEIIQPGRHDSMDLRVLLECEELDESTNNNAAAISDAEDGGVYLKIPSKMLASERSLWSSASTMTASIRTMTSTRSLMSHYSKESNRSLMNCSTANINNNKYTCQLLEESSRSLFCKSEEETPMLPPPQRTRSRESHFQSNASERPVRRPVRSPSDRSMTSASTITTSPSARFSGCNSTVSAPESSNGPNADATTKALRQQSLVPPLSLSICPQHQHQLLLQQQRNESSENMMPSIRLIRSLSEQTLETSWRETKGEGLHNEAFRSLLKRSLSDSLLFKTSIVSAMPLSKRTKQEALQEEGGISKKY